MRTSFSKRERPEIRSSGVASMRLGTLITVAAMSYVTACSPNDRGARGCVLDPRSRVYGLTGRWSNPSQASLGLCLRQFSATQVEGTINLDRREYEVNGAIAPSGAIFLTYALRPESRVLVIARRTADTLIVDWSGPATSVESQTPPVFPLGRLVRSK
jgi:hypothetical protein